MVWFGGLLDRLPNSDVFHVKLELVFDEDAGEAKTQSADIKSGRLTIKRLRNKEGKFVQLKVGDRFFYNQEFYMREPTQMMKDLGHDYKGKYQDFFFDKNRYIGSMGREAFHIFDLK